MAKLFLQSIYTFSTKNNRLHRYQIKLHGHQYSLRYACFFISLIFGRKFDKRNAYRKRYSLLKTDFKIFVAYTN